MLGKPAPDRTRLLAGVQMKGTEHCPKLGEVATQSRDGAVVRALASHHCGPGSTPGPGITCGYWSLLLVLVPALKVFLWVLRFSGRHGGLMNSALDSGASGWGLSPGQGHCVVILGKTLYFQSASLHPGV